jgi:Transposase IS116/IS110/IS902 family
LRALLAARRSAVKAHTAATNQIHALLVTAPAEVRERYRRHSITALVTALARCRPATYSDPTTVAVLTAGKALAQRTEFLERQKRDLTAQLDVLVQQTNPALRAAYGVGPDTAAQLLVTAGANPERLRSEASLAALCGVAPVPAPSGKITRHRLSRGGDRAANNALYRIAVVRMSAHPQTRDYVQRQAAHGRTKKERDSAAAQTSHHPRNIQTADTTHPDRRLSRPAAGPASQKPHPSHRRHSFRRPDNHHLPARTRPATQRHPGHQLPPMAHRCLTINSPRTMPPPIRDTTRRRTAGRV